MNSSTDLGQTDFFSNSLVIFASGSLLALGWVSSMLFTCKQLLRHLFVCLFLRSCMYAKMRFRQLEKYSSDITILFAI